MNKIKFKFRLKILGVVLMLICLIFATKNTFVLKKLAPDIKLTRKNHNLTSKLSPSCIIKPDKDLMLYYDPTKYDEIYFYHTRKAGGTTLSKYLHKVANIYNQNYSKTEGKRMLKKQNSRIFYVTVLRNPNERSISNFKYDIRWKCNKLMKNFDNITALNAKPFSFWLNKINIEYYDKVLWDCSANCYINWFSLNKYIKTTEEIMIKKTIKNLMNFDLILETRFMNNSKYIEKIESFFKVKNIKTRTAYCAKKSREANLKFPLVITEEEKDELKEQNKLDSIIFDNIFNCH